MADIGTAYVRIAPNMTGIQSKISSGFRGTGGQIATQMGGEISAKSAVIIGAIAGIAQAAITKAMRLVSNSIGDAVSRVDTLNRFPTVMQNLGYSSKDASKQVDRIATSLIGLPTSLDQLTTFVQRIAPMSGGVKKATDIALAFNNAVLAGGGPVYRQADAIEQFSQMLAKGTPDMMAWRTLQEAMPATLSQTAKALGIASGNTTELYDKLQTGKISFQDFTDAVVSLNDKGLPGFKSFAAQAKDSTSGIATGVANMQIAITRGVAKIIESIGSKNISEAIGNVGKSFESVLSSIATALPPVLSVLRNVFGFIAQNKDIFAPLAVGILAVVAAMKVWQIATTVATAVQAAFNIVLNANPISLIILAVVGLVAALTYFFTQTELGQAIMQAFGQVVSAVWDGIKAGLQAVGNFFSSIFSTIKNVVATAFNWIKGNWQLLLGILFGPVGIAAGLIIRNIDTIKAGFQAAFNFITGLWGRISGFFSNIFNNIKNAFSGVYDLGKNIIQGLINGIGSGAGAVIDKMKSIAKGAIDTVKSFLGIHSPSRVFDWIGQQISLGAAQGIDRKGKAVNQSASDMAQGAIDSAMGNTINPSVAFSASSAGSAGGGYGGGNTTQTVSIQTVVLGDANAVKEFFKQLNQDTINVGMGMTPIQGAQ